MLVERVKKILSKDVEVIIASTDSLELLSCYSILYLNGSTPRTCANSQREYYRELSQTGLLKAKLMEETKKRTCKPNWGKGCSNNNGLKYIHSEGQHYSSLHITDEQALNLLKKGLLSESDFDELPEGYQKPLEKFQETPAPKKEAKKRAPKN